MKKAFPHGMLAMSKDKHIVFLMKLGVLHKQYSLLEDAGVSNDDMVKHLVCACLRRVFARCCGPS